MKRLTIFVSLSLLSSVAIWRVLSGPLTYHVHPVLDCPLNAGQSVIYCGSFQLAWNQLTDLLDAPIDSEDTQLDDQLNAREFDVNSNCVSVFGGRNTTENRDHYISETADRFPNSASILPVNSHRNGEEFIVIAYLESLSYFRWHSNPLKEESFGLIQRASRARWQLLESTTRFLFCQNIKI